MPYLFVPADPAPPPTRTPSLLAARVSSYVLEVFGTLSGVWIDGASLLGGHGVVAIGLFVGRALSMWVVGALIALLMRLPGTPGAQPDPTGRRPHVPRYPREEHRALRRYQGRPSQPRFLSRPRSSWWCWWCVVVGVDNPLLLSANRRPLRCPLRAEYGRGCPQPRGGFSGRIAGAWRQILPASSLVPASKT